jgi:hypothetical protein
VNGLNDCGSSPQELSPEPSCSLREANERNQPTAAIAVIFVQRRKLMERIDAKPDGFVATRRRSRGVSFSSILTDWTL